MANSSEDTAELRTILVCSMIFELLAEMVSGIGRLYEVLVVLALGAGTGDVARRAVRQRGYNTAVQGVVSVLAGLLGTMGSVLIKAGLGHW